MPKKSRDNAFRDLLRGLPGQLTNGKLTMEQACILIYHLILKATDKGVGETVKATQEEQGEIDKPEINKMTNKARRGKRGTTEDEPSLDSGVVQTVADQEREVAFEWIILLARTARN